MAGGLLTLGRWLDGAMPVLWVLMAAVVVFLAAFAALPSFREKLTALWRAGHGDKGVARSMNDARLAQALSMGMASGMPMEEALELASGLLDDVPQTKTRCLECRARLEQGEHLAAAMRGSDLLPPGPAAFWNWASAAARGTPPWRRSPMTCPRRARPRWRSG